MNLVCKNSRFLWKKRKIRNFKFRFFPVSVVTSVICCSYPQKKNCVFVWRASSSSGFLKSQIFKNKITVVSFIFSSRTSRSLFRVHLWTTNHVHTPKKNRERKLYQRPLESECSLLIQPGTSSQNQLIRKRKTPLKTEILSSFSAIFGNGSVIPCFCTWVAVITHTP